MEVELVKITETHLQLLDVSTADALREVDQKMTALLTDIDEHLEDDYDVANCDEEEGDDDIYEMPRPPTLGRRNSTLSRSGTTRRSASTADRRELRRVGPRMNQVLRNRKRHAEAFFKAKANAREFTETRGAYDYDAKVAVVLTTRTTANSVASLFELAPPMTTMVVLVYIPQTFNMFDNVSVNESEYVKIPYTASLLRHFLLELGIDVKELNHIPYYASSTNKFGRRAFSLGRAPHTIRDNIMVSMNDVMTTVKMACYDQVANEYRDTILGHDDMPGFFRDKHVLKVLATLTNEDMEVAHTNAKYGSVMTPQSNSLILYSGRFDATAKFTHIMKWEGWEAIMGNMFTIPQLTAIKNHLRANLTPHQFTEYITDKTYPRCVTISFYLG